MIPKDKKIKSNLHIFALIRCRATLLIQLIPNNMFLEQQQQNQKGKAHQQEEKQQRSKNKTNIIIILSISLKLDPCQMRKLDRAFAARIHHKVWM